MENIRLEDIWCERLRVQGWNSDALVRFPFAWAPGTLSSYNRAIHKLQDYCVATGQEFPPRSEATVVGFLCDLTCQLTRPKSAINTACSAIANLCKAFGIKNILESEDLKLFANKSLVKATCTEPMRKSKVMPIAPFIALFVSWPDDYRLSIKDLRLKVLTLLALALMLRPSDVAPHGHFFNDTTQKPEALIFSTDNVMFQEDGSAKVRFFGIKNDTDRSGFDVTLPPAQPEKIDPVIVLKNYIVRTNNVRPADKRPLFLSLRRPYGAIASDTVAQILQEAILKAGLGGNAYSAKDFRPTGATAAIDNETDPEVAMRIGRWKTRSVFFDHYVHSRPPSDYSQKLLSHQ